MAYDSLAVANYFIDRAKAENVVLDPMKLLKLVYLAHGWSLGITGEPLLTERIQAWKFGPVINSLYHEFKGFGSRPIDRRGVFFASGSGQFDEPEVPPNAPEIPLLESVWRNYKHLTGGQLSSLTHQPGTPWWSTWHDDGGSKKMGAIIPDDLIQKHFDELRRQRS